MLESSEERVKLLKAGCPIKTIERLYIENNHFKIILTPTVFELVEFDLTQKKELSMRCEAAAEHPCSFLATPFRRTA